MPKTPRRLPSDLPRPKVLAAVRRLGFAFDREEYISIVNDPSEITVPVIGDVYLIGNNPTGAFAANKNELVEVATLGPTFTFVDPYVKAREVHPDIEEACLIQVGYLFRTRQWQGTQQATAKNSSVMVRSKDMPEPVIQLLFSLKREVVSNA